MSTALSDSSRLFKLPLLFAAVCVLLGFVSRVVYDRAAAAAAQNSAQTLAGREEDVRNNVREAFAGYQQSTLDVVDDLLKRPAFVLAMNDAAPSDAALFEAVKAPTPLPVAVELWSPRHQMKSWYGPQGASTDTAKLSGSLTSVLQEGPLYSYFTIIKPVRDAHGGLWHVVARRLFDVNYPISNQFIDNSVFETAFGSSLGYALSVSTGAADKRAGDSTLLAIPLPSLGGSTIGTVYADRPSPQDLSDEDTALGARISAAFFCAAGLGVLGVAFILWRRGRRGALGALLVLLWLFRYVLIWLDVPDLFGTSSLVDPSVFASPFGAGLARSVADLLISAVFLAISSSLVASWLLRASQRAVALPRLVRAAGVVAIAVISSATIRGFIATLHSTVFDSTLAYNDPTFILPPVELGVMLAALSLIALSVAVLLSALVSVAVGWCGGTKSTRAWLLWFIVAAAMGVAYAGVQQNTLIGHAGRTALLGLITVTAMFTWADASRRPLRKSVIFVAATALLLFPLLDQQEHDLDAAHIELLGADINRPSDAWITVLINQALDQLAGGETAQTIDRGSAEEVRKLAFTQWAKSILSREGNNCSVTYLGNGGTAVSDFQIGVTPHLSGAPSAGASPARRFVEIDRSASGSATRWHRGYAPILRDDSTLAGGVWLELAEERGLGVPRAGAPEFLTNYPRERYENRYRRLVISEYLNGRMATSSDETFPIERPLPASLVTAARTSGRWVDEQIAGKTYETYYLPLRTGAADGWVALSLEDVDLQWHLYSFVRSLLFYGIFVLVPMLVYLVAANRGTLRGLSRFKTRLTIAFVLVSLVPIALLAIYNKTYVEGRVRDADQRRLREQTQMGLAALQRQIGTATPFALSKLSDEQCMALSDQWGTDFNVYLGHRLQAGSRPEVVTAELLDTRLSADAYSAIVLQRHGFFSETQSIGRLPYLVGYRPIVSDDGRVVGIFSVPTLFRQREIDEMATRRNVFLFGTYALAVLISIALGTVVVNQVSKPILRLKGATSLVASGNLDLRVRTGRRDEIGELEEAFDEMTMNLKRSQDEIVKTQRELAWREMARQVAHEIKNPLTPMRLSIQHLRQAYADRVTGFETLLERITATVLEQIDALSRIASEFSTFARMPPREMQPCSVHAILRDVAALYQQEQLAFALSLRAENDVVRADPDELRRVVINIVRNSVQAMDGKGSVSVATASAQGTLTVRLADTGPGIADHLRGRLFEPNFSTKSEGMGLGLAIVKRAVEDVGGSVAVESAVGHGTTFILTLPLMPS